MKPIEEIQTIIREHKPELAERFGVSEIGVFGSLVRGEARDDSDVDILVEFGRPVTLFGFIDLETYLQQLLDIEKVDLVQKSGLKRYIGSHILREVQYV
jgi:predicted nucleotidyltransferase